MGCSGRMPRARQSGHRPQNTTSARSMAKPDVSDGVRHGAWPTTQGTSATASHPRHTAWWWLWMMDPEYQSGYENGWKQGRMQAKLEAQQESRNRELKENADHPPPLDDGPHLVRNESPQDLRTGPAAGLQS